MQAHPPRQDLKVAVLRAGGHRSPGWPEGSAPRQWSRRVLWPGQQGLGLAPDKPGGELRVRGAGPQPGRETPCHQDVPFSSCRAPPHPTGQAAGEMSVRWAGAWPPCIVQLGREEGQRGTGRERARLCSAPWAALSGPVLLRESGTERVLEGGDRLVASHAPSSRPTDQRGWACTLHLPTEAPAAPVLGGDGSSLPPAPPPAA